MTRSLTSDPSFMRAMPSTGAAMREAESAVPTLGLLTVVLAFTFVVSVIANHFWATGTFVLGGYAALFTAALAVIVLSARSVIAYGILSFNAVVHETLRVCPIPVLAVKPLPHQTGFYASFAEAPEPDASAS